MSPEQFRAARDLLGLDQYQLAAVLRVHQSTVSRYENGTRTVDVRTEAMLEWFVAGFRPPGWPSAPRPVTLATAGHAA